MKRNILNMKRHSCLSVEWEDEPVISFRKRENMFMVAYPFYFYVMIDGEEIEFTAKSGFEFDGASIPRPFKSLIGGPLDNLYSTAALIHDILYASEFFPRTLSDNIFLCAMKFAGVSWWRRTLMWFAVRLCGGCVWRKHTPVSVDYARTFLFYQKSYSSLNINSNERK